MVVVNKNHIAASSLMETLAAMVIIIASFSSGFGLFEQVLHSSRTELRKAAKAEAIRLIRVSHPDAPDMDKSNAIQFHVDESWSPFEPGTSLHQVVIRDTEGKQLYKLQRIQIDENE